MKILRIPICFILIFTVCTTGGCWNRRDPEQLAIIIAIGFDYDEEKEMYEIIAQVANPIAMGSPVNGGGDIAHFKTISAYGHTPYEASRNLALNTTRAPVFAHTQIIIISESLSRKGILPVMDAVDRGRGIRLNTRLLIAKEGDLHDILKAEFPMEHTGARGIVRQFVTARFFNKTIPIKFTNEIIHTLAAPGKDILVARIELAEDWKSGTEDNNEENHMEADAPSPVKISGAAAFRGDRLAGWVDEDVVQGWAFMWRDPFRTPMIVLCPAHDEHTITLELISHENRIKPIIEGDSIKIEVNIYARGRIQDITCPAGFEVQQTEAANTLKQRAAQVIRNHIEGAVSKCQELDSDFIGFGYLIYRTRPKVWEKVEHQWREIFREIQVDINVEFDIMRTGLVKEPPKVWGGDDE